MQAMIAKQVFYSGDVQGDGFRYAISHESLSNDVTGLVQNLGDGRVEVKVMGYPNVVDQFLQSIRDHPASYGVENVEEKEIELLKGMSGFKVH